MGKFTVGSIVLVRFPFTDLSNSKLRPAVVLVDAQRGDYILCQITSQTYSQPHTIQLDTIDFATGSLNRVSYARYSKLFTANDTIIQRTVGTLTTTKMDDLVQALIQLFATGK